MDKYKNKKAELLAFAKMDEVPSDLQWLCEATVDIINRLQTDNKRLKRKIAHVKKLQKRYSENIGSIFTGKYIAQNIEQALKP